MAFDKRNPADVYGGRGRKAMQTGGGSPPMVMPRTGGGLPPMKAPPPKMASRPLAVKPMRPALPARPKLQSKKKKR